MNRSLLIDLMKVLASQIIVWHHFSLYSPMAEALALAWPSVVDALNVHGRLAVQPFLVIGGYLAARSVSKVAPGQALRTIWQRYLRLMPPFGLALLLVLLSTWAMAPAVYGEDWVSPWPTIGQFVAHLLLLHDVLGVPALSAGAWYVAIDLQLFAGLTLLTVWSRRRGQLLADSGLPALIALLTGLSISVFSRLEPLDVWAVYFVGAYGLGALALWAPQSARARRCLVVAAVWLLLDVLVDPRPRPLLALATAVALLYGAEVRLGSWRSLLARGLAWGSDISYGVFVAHFAVIILTAGLWELGGFDSARAGLAGWLLAWGLALGLGAIVQRMGAWPLRQVSTGTA